MHISLDNCGDVTGVEYCLQSPVEVSVCVSVLIELACFMNTASNPGKVEEEEEDKVIDDTVC